MPKSDKENLDELLNNVEIESIPKLISKPLKERIRVEAMELNFLKRTSYGKLPL